jgi:uncharacterized metal-binding protein
MPNLPAKKVGLIACSGEELAGGTVTRLAVRKVLEELRPELTVTLCLPLFLAGEERERAFARFYPTLTVDGCDRRCAARATEKYSAVPAASFVVSEKLSCSPRRLDEAGMAAVEALAAAIAARVDQLLGGGTPVSAGEMTMGECACGSGIPVARLELPGRTLELLALPALLETFRDQGRLPDSATLDVLMEQVKIYNALAPEDLPAVREAVDRAYRTLVGRES